MPEQGEASDSLSESTTSTPEVSAENGADQAAGAADVQGGTAEPGEGAPGVADEPGDEGAEAGTSEAGGEHGDAGEPGEPGAKRKRRRRRKKKGESTASGELPAPEAQQAQPRAPKKEGARAPFVRFFSGAAAGKRHAFSVGEIVAGRVSSVGDGTITVDLFGKAVAFVDEREPREIPVMPEPVVAPVASAPAPDAVPAGDEAAAQTLSADGAAADPALQLVDDDATTLAGAEGVSAELAAAEAAEGEAEAVDDHDVDSDDVEGESEAEGPKGPLAVARLVPEDLPTPPAVTLGAIFRGRVGAVSESGHIAILNRLTDRASVRKDLQTYRKERRRVEGLVYGFNRGGFDVMVCGLRAFCPASAMALEDIEDPHALLGKKYEFLLPASRGGKDIVVSRRSILERLQRKHARELLKNLQPGQVLKGRVTQVREFGAFVDIGGIEGLVHQSELSFGHGVRPQDVCKPGDELDVKVLRIGDPAGRDRDRDGRRDRVTRVSLSVKALLPDPWSEHDAVLAEGSVQVGRVTRTTDFGAFIELAPSIEGLLHISELGRELKHASQAINEGDEVHVIVERVDRGARRISLSKLSPGELQDFQEGKLGSKDALRNMRPGAIIMVKVERVEPRGVVVRVDGAVGRRARGYLPSSETGTERGTDLRKLYPLGRELEVKIIGNDREGGLRCSVKALAVDEERKAVRDYRKEAAKQGFGTFGDLLKAKLGG
jgi:small subunit ribosomal protein S1